MKFIAFLKIARPCPSSGRFHVSSGDDWCGAETLQDEHQTEKPACFVTKSAME